MNTNRAACLIGILVCAGFLGCKPARRDNIADTQSIEALQSAGQKRGNYRLGCGPAQKEIASQSSREAFQNAYAALPVTIQVFFKEDHYRRVSREELTTKCAGPLNRAKSRGEVVTAVNDLDACWIPEKIDNSSDRLPEPVVYLEDSAQAIHSKLLVTTAAAFDEYYIGEFSAERLQGQPETHNQMTTAFRALAEENKALSQTLFSDFDDMTKGNINKIFPKEKLRNTFIFSETVDSIYCSSVSWERFQQGAPRTANFVGRDGGLVPLLGKPWWLR